MTLHVVELLRSFLTSQSAIEGPFDTPEAFFEALQDFLDNQEARVAVSDLWIRHTLESGNADGQHYSVDQVFAHIQERAEHRLSVQMREETRGIASDQQAIEIILAHIACVGDPIEELTYEAFCKNPFMHRIVERSVQVTASALQVLSHTVTDGLDPTDVKQLTRMAAQTRVIGEPLSPASLWQAYREIFPRLVRALQASSVATGNGANPT